MIFFISLIGLPEGRKVKRLGSREDGRGRRLGVAPEGEELLSIESGDCLLLRGWTGLNRDSDRLLNGTV